MESKEKKKHRLREHFSIKMENGDVVVGPCEVMLHDHDAAGNLHKLEDPAPKKPQAMAAPVEESKPEDTQSAEPKAKSSKKAK